MKHIHSSGRYDRPLSAVRSALKRYALAADLITLTETHRRSREDLSLDGYGLVKYLGPGAGDPAILFDEAVWSLADRWSHQLTTHEQRRGPGGPRPPHATTALLRHKKSGRKVLVTVAHLPSHVEGDWFQGTWRVFVWRDAQKNWKRIINRLRKQNGGRVVYVADWNINFKRRVFRALIKALYPRLRLAWRPPFPARGTHHKRIIDATVTNMRVVEEARLIRDDDSSDHRPYFERLEF